ncbi:hypothetical protein J132_04918 [Termitomyces sp. J132]|nr:hypothetical protein H2248_001185 [Termitomyces sp. 'cryptogamus']KNZ80675.1 hypothetical protein J132_04918 [Termitomyces sp. J132]
MYALRCRSCVGRRAPLLVPFSRSNSTVSSSEEPVPGPAPPKPSSARIASSWGDIVIPSRQEILNRKNKANSYKPDLSYLASGESSGFAHRLAAKRTSSSEPSDKLQQKPVEKIESPEARSIRIQAATAARRAEREARQHVAAVAREAAQAARAAERVAREAEKAAKEAAAQKIAERVAIFVDQRRAERLRREASSTPRQRLAVDESLTETRLGSRPGLRPGPRPRRGPSQKAQSSSKPSRFPKKPNFRIQTMPAQDANVASAKDDITLEIIEAGGDEKEPPEITSPDVSLTDFDSLFSPSFERRVEKAIHLPLVPLSPGQIQMLREAYGGAYQRFAPQTNEDFVMQPSQLGPLKHAGIVLSHRSDVSIGARSNALDIISTAVGGAGGARTIQTTVN